MTKGDCFEANGTFWLNHSTIPNIKLIHAEVSGQGSLKGIRFAHAWVEIGDVVIDQSNGRSIVMRKEQYHERAKVVYVEGKFQEYDKESALYKLAEEAHWGPWDLSCKL